MEKFYINPDMTYWGSVVDSDVLPFDGAQEVPTPPDSNASQTWNGTGWNAYIPPAPSPIDQLEAIITQGQIAMEEAPLPDDIQKQIYDLEVFVQNYYRRGAIPIILDTINGFSIAAERQDVTEGQRAQVEALKVQMLAVFNG